MKLHWLAGLALVLTVACAATTAPHAPLQLFDATLKGETRAQLCQVLTSHGMKALREDERCWVDECDPSGVLSGASEFNVT